MPVDRLEVEQAGPEHAVILAATELPRSGSPASGFAHRARIHAFAGSPLLQVDYFVVNTDSRRASRVEGSMASKVAVKSVSLQLRPDRPITLRGHRARFGGRCRGPGSEERGSGGLPG